MNGAGIGMVFIVCCNLIGFICVKWISANGTHFKWAWRTAWALAILLRQKKSLWHPVGSNLEPPDSQIKVIA